MQLAQLMSKSPIVLALDTNNLSRCSELIASTMEYVGIYKLGLEFFNAHGKAGIEEIQQRFPEIRIFLDLKLHDIPNTVKGACSSLNSLNLEILTVHAAGGPEMIAAAVTALPEVKIAAVTVLTSLNQDSLSLLGISLPLGETVLKWATLSVSAGARAIVSSPQELEALNAGLPAETLLITPGIRIDHATDDQRRTLSAQQALSLGANLLVIGRPITASVNPRNAAREIFESLHF